MASKKFVLIFTPCKKIPKKSLPESEDQTMSARTEKLFREWAQLVQLAASEHPDEREASIPVLEAKYAEWRKAVEEEQRDHQ